MTEGQASEPPQGTPGRRALGAMESAVRRARESAGATPGAAPPSPSPPSPPIAGGRAPTRERWLVGAVITAAVLLVLSALALAASLTETRSSTSVPPTVAAPAHTSAPSPGGRSSPHGSGGSPSALPTTTTPSTTMPPVSPTPGGAPVISALDPASGTAGQGIQIAGANFLSSSGQIVATFNGQVAPTTCPAQSTCTVTVPPLPGTASAQVVVTTSAGSSNSETFTYS